MKLLHTLLFGLVTLLPSTGTLSGAESVQDAFRRGLLAEETTRDLKAAAEAYAEAIRLSADQRAIQATALFRLAEGQKKLGNNAEATATLQRVAREYPEQRELLAKSGIAAGGTFQRSTSHTVELIRNQLESAVATTTSKTEEIESLFRKKAQLSGLDGVKFAARVPAEFSNPELARLIAEFNQAAIKRANLGPDFGPEHPEMKRLDALLEALRQLMREQQVVILERIDEAISEKNQQQQSLRKRSAVLNQQQEAMEKTTASKDVFLVDPDSGQPTAATSTPAISSTSGGGRSPGTVKDFTINSTTLSEADLRSQIDSLSAELEVLQKLPDALERGRFIVSRHREQTSDQFRSDVTTWSTRPSSSRTNDYWQRFESLVTNYTRPIEDRLRFARMELEVLQKQRAEREPITVIFCGARQSRITFKASEHPTLSDAVLQSGETDTVDLRRVRLHRRGEKGGEDILTADVQSMLKTGDRKGDIELRNGDRIEVREKRLF